MKPLGLITTGALLLLLGTVAPAYAQQDQPELAKSPKQAPTAKVKQQPPPPPAAAQRQRQPEPVARPETEQERAMGQRRQPPDQAPQTPQQPARVVRVRQVRPVTEPQRAIDQHQRQPRAAKPPTRAQLAKAPEGEQHVHRPSAEGRHVQQRDQRSEWQHYRAQTWRSEHRNWNDRGGYHGYRIPDDRFRPYFGRGHWFRIYDRPMVIVGRHPRFQYEGYWFSMVDPWPEYWSDNWYQTDDVYIDYTDDGYYLYNRNHPDDRVAVNVYVD